VFDWDIIKRQQLAAGGDGSIEMNPDGTARPAAGAGLMGTGGGDTGAGADDAGYPGNAATASGRAVADSGKGGEGGPADGSRQDDSAGEGRDQGQRRSIISSIR
jgi:hypothetical protein